MKGIQEKEESPSTKRVQSVAYILLLLMGLAAIVTLQIDVSNYLSSVRGVRELRLNIVDLKIVDDDNPRALIRFSVLNQSPLEIELESYHFTLYLEGKFIGGSQYQYRGTNPDANPGEHIKAQTINRVLGPGQRLSLAYKLYIYKTKMEIVRHTQPTRFKSWQVKADFTVFLPNSRNKSHIKLKAQYEK